MVVMASAFSKTTCAGLGGSRQGLCRRYLVIKRLTDYHNLGVDNNAAAVQAQPDEENTETVLCIGNPVSQVMEKCC